MWSKLVTQTAGGRFRGHSNDGFRSCLASAVDMAAHGCFGTNSKNVQGSSFSTLQISGKSQQQDGIVLKRPGMKVRHLIGCTCCDMKMDRRDPRHQYFSTQDNQSANKEVVDDQSNTDEIKIPGAEKGGRKLAIIFTCTHCETRSAKQFTERSYKHGVVIATCPGCNKKHLIADNMGFFSDEDGGWNIEIAMAKLGANVKVATNDDVLELSMEDIYTKEAIDNAVKNAKGGTSKADPNSGGKD